MTRKLQQLSKVLGNKNEEELELWKVSVETAKPVLDVLCGVIREKREATEKAMKLSNLTDSGDPGALLLGLQAKKEAYDEILSLILDK